MERLTKRELADSMGRQIVLCNHEESDCNDSCMYGSCEWERKALQKLKAYEDAEEQGLLLRLPCKIGDTVYAFTPFCEVCEAPLLYEHICENCAKGDFITETKFDYEMIPMVGKNVFLTKEEAEQALERMEKENG